MSLVTTLGFARIGRKRELKTALEAHWKGALPAAGLLDAAAALRERHWHLQRDAGADVVPVNDFSLYDHVLDTAWLFGAVPAPYLDLARGDPLAAYFASARGSSRYGLRALEMTKWFDTNYHYLVPELSRDTRFTLLGDKPVADFEAARAAGFAARPVLLGPVSFLLLSKSVDGSDRLALLDRLVPAYAALLQRLAEAGADWVQLDEPCLVLDLDDGMRHAFRYAYDALAQTRAPRRFLTASFGGLDDNLALAMALPVQGLHVDLVRAPGQLDAVLDALPDDRVLSLGLVDGRNVWRADLHAALALLRRARAAVSPGRLWLAPSCSLLHVPIDLAAENALDTQARSWLAFGREKVAELRTLADAAAGEDAALAAVAASREAVRARRQSARAVDPAVRARVASAAASLGTRASAQPQRAAVQARTLALPLFPTTTIGSFPQTSEVRQARAANRSGRLDDAAYARFLQAETERCVRDQEALGIDVFVHGEFERNDMVEYFGEQLAGFLFTTQGWVQSYGSRCVKPPVIVGDVSRPQPMTVDWARYAQGLTVRPMKGMLTGPVTLLQWSFVRDDLPRAEVCAQIALALRDEVQDLEHAGIRVIQVDEPALREGLPLRRRDRDAYLQWAVAAFRLATGGVADATQVHTHMCYAKFDDIIEAVAALDADVVSIETSRSRMALLDTFARYAYPSGVGPGVYDIHSPRVPGRDDMLALLRRARARLGDAQLWVNPDCGLKTRAWDEVRPALAAMVEAARQLRAEAAQRDFAA